jgi:ABC-type uncharacterized transport system substrate-binding protein
MRRRTFIAGLGAAATLPFSSRAEQALRRIAVLIGFAEHDPATQRRVAAFLKGLAGLGRTPGRNVRIDFRCGGGDTARNGALAKEVVSLNPDMIFVNSTSATAAI